MALTATSDASAGAQFQSVAQAAGIDVSHLTAVAQLQLAVASIMTDTPPGSVAAADIASGTFGANIPDTGEYKFPGVLSILGATLNLGTVGAAFAIAGTTVASVADTASGATTIKANIGRGTGAVGGFIFQVPVTTSTGTTAQTLTTVLTLDATTTVRAVFAGAVTVGTTFLSTGAATFSSTVRVNGAASLGTAAGTDIAIIDGTGFGAGVASLRMNGLTTAATSNQVGTLANAPSAGNPSFWMPISIAGAIRYIPCWT